MKKRIFSALLAVVLLLSVLSLSSCYMLDYLVTGFNGSSGKDNSDGSGEDGKDIIYNVQSGDTNNITVNSNDSADILVASKTVLSVVSVYSKFKVRTGGYFQNNTEETYSGAGVIYKLDKEKGDAYVITNYHVVYNYYSQTQNKISDDISLYLYGIEATKYAIKAEYVGGSPHYDLAVLKVTNSQVLRESPAAEATVADSDKVTILEKAIAVGNPEGTGISATVGYVNVDSEEIYIKMIIGDEYHTIPLRVMRIDTAVNGGNSGGGLFNGKGDLIGIVNAKSADTEIENIGYAIPSNVAVAVADNIIDYCDTAGKHYKQGNQNVFRSIVGITPNVTELDVEYDTQTGKIIKSEKVVVASIEDGKLATGKLKVGDVINSITIDGTEYKITRKFHVFDRMLKARTGSTVVFNVTREGAEQKIEFTITEQNLVAY